MLTAITHNPFPTGASQRRLRIPEGLLQQVNALVWKGHVPPSLAAHWWTSPVTHSRTRGLAGALLPRPRGAPHPGALWSVDHVPTLREPRGSAEPDWERHLQVTRCPGRTRGRPPLGFLEFFPPPFRQCPESSGCPCLPFLHSLLGVLCPCHFLLDTG